jgi:hypothetical protein
MLFDLERFRREGFFERAQNDPAILHFNWKIKPWLRAFIPTGQAKTWWAYALAAPVHWRLKLREPLATRRLVRALLEPSVLVRAVRVRRLLRARLASRFRRGD